MVKISTRLYENTHGKTPKGYGWYGFCPRDKVCDDNYLEYAVFFRGTYRQARCNLKCSAIALVVSEFEVLP